MTLSALRSEAENVSDSAWKNDRAPVSRRYTSPSPISSGRRPISCSSSSALKKSRALTVMLSIRLTTSAMPTTWTRRLCSPAPMYWAQMMEAPIEKN